MSDIEHIINECRYCGNKTKLEVITSYNDSKFESHYEDSFIGQEWVSNTKWLILKCAVCDEISIATYYVDEELREENAWSFCLVYPTKSYLTSEVPQKVKNSFEVALKAKHMDLNLCALALRRTLEIICVEQLETSGKLQEKIQNLAAKGVLPNVLSDASHIIRKFGNEAAHGDDTFNESTINQLIDFVELIIDYIYVVPHRIKLINER